MKKAIIGIFKEMGKTKDKNALASISIRSLDDKVEIVDDDPEMAPAEFTKTKVVYDPDKIAANLQKAVDLGIAVIHYDRKSITIKV